MTIPDILGHIGLPLLFTTIGGTISWIVQYWLGRKSRRRKEYEEDLEFAYGLKEKVESLIKETIELHDMIAQLRNENSLLKIEVEALKQSINDNNGTSDTTE